MKDQERLDRIQELEQRITRLRAGLSEKEEEEKKNESH